MRLEIKPKTGHVELFQILLRPATWLFSAFKFTMIKDHIEARSSQTFTPTHTLALPTSNITVFLPLFQAMYMFYALAIVCDDFFVPSLEKICEVCVSVCLRLGLFQPPCQGADEAENPARVRDTKSTIKSSGKC